MRVQLMVELIKDGKLLNRDYLLGPRKSIPELLQSLKTSKCAFEEVSPIWQSVYEPAEGEMVQVSIIQHINS